MNSSKPSLGIAPKAHSLKKREKNERRFRLITERMGDITSTLTFSPNPTYTYVNPSVEGILGYKPEELIGRSTWEYIHPDDKKNMLPLLKRCLGDYQSTKIPMSLKPKESMNHSYTLECRFRDKSGKFTDINIFLKPEKQKNRQLSVSLATKKGFLPFKG